jgi:hypothetical protein
MRAAGFFLAGLLLFAVFSHAHAQSVNNQSGDNYGLKRFDGDNYDTLPPGAGMPAPPSPQGYAPVSGSSVSPNGYEPVLAPHGRGVVRGDGGGDSIVAPTPHPSRC